jgi:predicted TIM-barrel fold metal-dependent hydrolase
MEVRHVYSSGVARRLQGISAARSCEEDEGWPAGSAAFDAGGHLRWGDPHRGGEAWWRDAADYPGLGAAVSAFPLETALATVSLPSARILHRFPKLRILLSHGGGAAPWIVPRIHFACSNGNVLRDYLPEAAGNTLRRFWYDTIVYDSAALTYLAERVGGDRLVVGSDYPFAIRQPQPAAFARQALGRTNLTANAKVLLGRTATERP